MHNKLLFSLSQRELSVLQPSLLRRELSVLQLVAAQQDCVEEFASNLIASRHLNSVDVVKLEAREALSNALGHARAREVEHAVHLRQISPHLRVVKKQARLAWLRMDWH